MWKSIFSKMRCLFQKSGFHVIFASLRQICVSPSPGLPAKLITRAQHWLFKGLLEGMSVSRVLPGGRRRRTLNRPDLVQRSDVLSHTAEHEHGQYAGFALRGHGGAHKEKLVGWVVRL
jgi:hypothetical protein